VLPAAALDLEGILNAETRQAMARFETFASGTCTDADAEIEGPDGRTLPRFVVTSEGDDGGPDALRTAIEVAAERGGGQILFDRILTGATITLKKALRPGSGTVVDGGCRNITLTADQEDALIIVRDARDITIRGLRIKRMPSPYDANIDGDAITAFGALDRIVIENNRFAWCGDGCVDVTRMTGAGTVTIRRNLFQRHNKVMLIASCFASDSDGCPVNPGGARFKVEVLGNVFFGTAQRHPKAYGPVFVHAAGNLVIYRSLPYSDGRSSAAYGMQASHGAEIFAEANAFAYAGEPNEGAFAVRGEAAEQATLRSRANWMPGSEALVTTAAAQAKPSYDAGKLAAMPTFAAAARCIVERLSRPDC
jgi:pectate lyase